MHLIVATGLSKYSYYQPFPSLLTQYSVPIFWASCGTLTTAPTAAGYPGSGNIFRRLADNIFSRGDNDGCVNDKAKTTQNYCNTTVSALYSQIKPFAGSFADY